MTGTVYDQDHITAMFINALSNTWCKVIDYDLTI